MTPSYFPLMFEQNKDSQKATEYKPEGRTTFDDLTAIKEIQQHKLDTLQLE